MAKKLDPRLIEILKEYGEDPNEALWDCHGTWVAYHKAIERIAAKAGVKFERPDVTESDAAAKIAVIVVGGTMGDRYEWSFGEATPYNNKNGYPFAMAEKRAKDRVVLKLVGLHGLVYSEEESDDFKPQKASAPQAAAYAHDGMERQAGDPASKSSAQLKREGIFDEFKSELLECETLVMLEKFKAIWREKIRHDGWPDAWKHSAKDLIEGRENDIMRAMDDAELSTVDPKTAFRQSVKFERDDPRTSPANTILAGG